MEKRIVIMGATSGFGRGLAERFLKAGWIVGVAGRREEALKELERLAPGRVVAERIDILSEDAPERLKMLIERLGGMDLYLHSSGIALMSDMLDPAAEVRIALTNVVGFTRMVLAAYRYFEQTHREGRLVAISSVAGVRGLESLLAYSASKSYDSTLLEGLRQRANRDGLRLRVVDIRPGWTRTPLLSDDKKYMLEMDAERATDKIFRAALKAKRTATIGWQWKLLTTIERHIPSPLYERLHLPLWKSR